MDALRQLQSKKVSMKNYQKSSNDGSWFYFIIGNITGGDLLGQEAFLTSLLLFSH